MRLYNLLLQRKKSITISIIISILFLIVPSLKGVSIDTWWRIIYEFYLSQPTDQMAVRLLQRYSDRLSQESAPQELGLSPDDIEELRKRINEKIQLTDVEPDDGFEEDLEQLLQSWKDEDAEKDNEDIKFSPFDVSIGSDMETFPAYNDTMKIPGFTADPIHALTDPYITDINIPDKNFTIIMVGDPLLNNRSLLIYPSNVDRVDSGLTFLFGDTEWDDSLLYTDDGTSVQFPSTDLSDNDDMIQLGEPRPLLSAAQQVLIGGTTYILSKEALDKLSATANLASKPFPVISLEALCEILPDIHYCQRQSTLD
jgi:hypothetical protein